MLSLGDAARLARILRMLGSSHDGEVVAPRARPSRSHPSAGQFNPPLQTKMPAPVVDAGSNPDLVNDPMTSKLGNPRPQPDLAEIDPFDPGGPAARPE